LRGRVAFMHLLKWATGLSLLAGLSMAILYAPTDRIQGHAQRIFYFHVPLAWVGFGAFAIVAVAGLLYLLRPSEVADRWARSAAEIGVVFTTLVLITGSIWGRAVWGTWWTWDARLTTTLILWTIYVAYLLVRAYAGDRVRAARYGAVIGIIGFLNVPIVYLSVVWWRTLHPGPTVVTSEGVGMPMPMLWTLLLNLLAFTLLFVFLMAQKLRVEAVRDRISGMEEALGAEAS
jgi:heme exporter protein C